MENEYFRQEWLFEQEKIVDQKRNLQKFLNDLKSTPDERKTSCENCFDLIPTIYHKKLVGIYEKDQHIKEWSTFV